MSSSVKLFSKYLEFSNILIETGTFTGDGIKCALNSGFEKVYSCDINSEFIENAKNKYKDHNVQIENLESQEFLKKILPKITERVVIFLDAHSMPFDTNKPDKGFGSDTLIKGVEPCPLEKELAAIKEHSNKDHIILIDDYQCFNTWMFDGLGVSDISKSINQIKSKYKVKLCGNVLCYQVDDFKIIYHPIFFFLKRLVFSIKVYLRNLIKK